LWAVNARRVAAVVGGGLFGWALGAQSVLFADPMSGGAGFAGLIAGLGLGLLVASTVRE